MFCHNCQRDIADGSRFCYHCGARQPEAQAYAARPKTPLSERRLMRSATQKKVAGVCAGFADYFDFDVTIVRLIWVIGTIMSGFIPGVVVYLIAWLVMPEGQLPLPAPAPVEPASTQPPASR